MMISKTLDNLSFSVSEMSSRQQKTKETQQRKARQQTTKCRRTRVPFGFHYMTPLLNRKDIDTVRMIIPVHSHFVFTRVRCVVVTRKPHVSQVKNISRCFNTYTDIIDPDAREREGKLALSPATLVNELYLIKEVLSMFMHLVSTIAITYPAADAVDAVAGALKNMKTISSCVLNNTGPRRNTLQRP